MRLNTLKPAEGSKSNRKRVGRGIGSGSGKTCGRGHKGQHSRSGGFHKVGFEGGQMPLQRRLPKRGFASRTDGLMAEIRLYQLEGLEHDVIDIDVLRSTGLINRRNTGAKVVLSGEITRGITLKGIKATAGAAKAIEAAGGKVETE